MTAADSLFAYGSLLFPEVWMHVVGGERPSAEAELAGHAAFTVRGYSFPGLVPSSPDDATAGRLYFGLDADDWRRLDAFEDTFYRRLPVEVIDSEGRRHGALTYIVEPAQRAVLSDARWTAAWFAEHALGDFLDRICGFDPPP